MDIVAFFAESCITCIYPICWSLPHTQSSTMLLCCVFVQSRPLFIARPSSPGSYACVQTRARNGSFADLVRNGSFSMGGAVLAVHNYTAVVGGDPTMAVYDGMPNVPLTSIWDCGCVPVLLRLHSFPGNPSPLPPVAFHITSCRTKECDCSLRWLLSIAKFGRSAGDINMHGRAD